MSYDKFSVDTLIKTAKDLNNKYGNGTRRWTVDGNNAGPYILDTQTGKKYGFFFIMDAKIDAMNTPTVLGPKKKPSTTKKELDARIQRRKLRDRMSQDAFDEDDLTEFLEHYGVLGMKWGVRRTPEQLGKGINKLERKRKRAEKRYQKVERTKGSMTYAKYNKKSYKTQKKLDKAERRLMDFMKTNFELFGESQSYLNGKQADIGRKWLDIASANPDDRFWMIMGERMRQRG